MELDEKLSLYPEFYQEMRAFIEHYRGNKQAQLGNGYAG